MCALEIKEVERLLAQHYISRTLSQLQFMQFKVQSSTQIHDVNSNENDDDDESRIWRVERERIFMNEKKNIALVGSAGERRLMRKKIICCCVTLRRSSFSSACNYAF